MPFHGYQLQEADGAGFALPAAPSIAYADRSAAATGTVGQSGANAYNLQPSILAGVSLAFTKESGTLPPGLSLDPTTGAITGVPTTANTYSGIVIRATDPWGRYSEQTLELTINAAPTISDDFPDAVAGVAYSETIDHVGGTGDGSWQATSGTLPTGASLVDNGDGTVTLEIDDPQVETANFTLTFTDDNGVAVAKAFEVVIAAASIFAGTAYESADGVYFEADDILTKWYQDFAATTLCDGTNDQNVRKTLPSGGSLCAYFGLDAANFKYAAPGSARDVGGKGGLYATSGNFTADAIASAMCSGRSFECIFVANRYADLNNAEVLCVGTNEPFNTRQYNADLLQAFGFKTAYIEVVSSIFADGEDHVVLIYCDDDNDKIGISVDGETVIEDTWSSDTWAADSGPVRLVGTECTFAAWGFYDGISGDAAAIVAAAKTKFGIA